MKILKNISEKNLIFPKGFILNREKKIFFDLKLSGLGLSMHVKKRNENLAGLFLSIRYTVYTYITLKQI